MATTGSRVRSETVIFQGITFRRYPDSPRPSDRVYFRPNGGLIKQGVENLHREIWKAHHGPIPPGWQVHHKDGRPLNNDPANLDCLPAGLHHQHHAQHLSEAARARARALIVQIQPLAAAWHRSPEGRAWHREHGKRVWEGKTPQPYACTHCGRGASSLAPANARFCSNACKSAARRRAKVDDVERACAHCGATFRVNRYAPTQTCTRSCGAFMRWARRRERTKGGEGAERGGHPPVTLRGTTQRRIGTMSVARDGIGHAHRSGCRHDVKATRGITEACRPASASTSTPRSSPPSSTSLPTR
jgi:hypothetical protein